MEIIKYAHELGCRGFLPLQHIQICSSDPKLIMNISSFYQNKGRLYFEDKQQHNFFIHIKLASMEIHIHQSKYTISKLIVWSKIGELKP